MKKSTITSSLVLSLVLHIIHAVFYSSIICFVLWVVDECANTNMFSFHVFIWISAVIYILLAVYDTQKAMKCYYRFKADPVFEDMFIGANIDWENYQLIKERVAYIKSSQVIKTSQYLNISYPLALYYECLLDELLNGTGNTKVAYENIKTRVKDVNEWLVFIKYRCT